MKTDAQDAQIIGGLYSSRAHDYEEHVVPRFEPVARRTVELAEIQPGDHVLDVGCGTGLATFLAAERTGDEGEVVGIDYSQGQLAVAERKRSSRNLTNVKFERMDSTQLAFEREFDVVVCNLGVPPDFDATFGGIRKALRPGGRLSVSEWGSTDHPVYRELRAALQRHRVEKAPERLATLRTIAMERRKRFEALETEAGFSRALEAAGFREVRVGAVDHTAHFQGWKDAFDYANSWGVFHSEVTAMTPATRVAFEAELQRAWPEGPFAATWRFLHAAARA